MNNQLTVLIPTSPIPSHPSTAILDETISNIRKYTDAKIIIMSDGVHDSLINRELDYVDYLMQIEHHRLKDYGDCILVHREEHDHQAIMTRQALIAINTPLVMFCEHDTSPIGEIPFQQICDMVEGCGEVNCIRFNIFEQIPEEHNYLMLGSDNKCGIPIQRTIQWSQRPHIARTEWYREILSKWFKPDHKTMIEDVMHGVVQTEYEKHGKDTFGLAIYTPEGNQLRSYHSDGRGSDEKIIEG